MFNAASKCGDIGGRIENGTRLAIKALYVWTRGPLPQSRRAMNSDNHGSNFEATRSAGTVSRLEKVFEEILERAGTVSLDEKISA